MKQVQFRQMKEGTRQEYEMLNRLETAFALGTADRLLGLLDQLDESLSGYRVSRLEHSLQAAARAWHDSADADWTIGALLHDVGDLHAPYSHGELAAAVLRPFVREQVTWCVRTHADFQLIYYGQHLPGVHQHQRNRHSDSPYFEDAIEFCERWDQASFDPEYKTPPLDFFEPMLRAVFTRAPHDPDHVQPGRRVPLVQRPDIR